MKLLHRKFFSDTTGVQEKTNKFSARETSKRHYILNQFLIWFFIISIVMFVINYLEITTYLNP